MDNGHTTWIIGIMCSNRIFVHFLMALCAARLWSVISMTRFSVFLPNNLLLRSQQVLNLLRPREFTVVKRSVNPL